MNIISANTIFIKIASLRLKTIADISAKNSNGRAVELMNLPITLHKSNATHSKRYISTILEYCASRLLFSKNI